MTQPFRWRAWPVAVVLMMLAAVAAGVVISPRPALASGPGAWAYALVDPAPIPVGSTFQPSPSRMDSSIDSPASVTKNAIGRYTVTFPALATVSGLGIAHVNAATVNRECAIIEYLALAGDIVLTVSCGGPGVFYADSAFNIIYTSAPGVLSGVAGAYAYVRTEQVYGEIGSLYQPVVQRTTGDRIEVMRTGDGVYNVYLYGTGAALDGGDIQVSAYGSRARCQPEGWSTHPYVANSQYIRVHCYDDEGAGQNNNFSLTFMRKRNILGTTAGRFAYSTSEGGPHQEFNSTGGIGGAIQYTTHDDWYIPFPGEPDNGPFFVMATPLARSRTICAAANFALAPGNPSILTGRTECFGATPGHITPTSLVFLSTRSMSNEAATTGEVELGPRSIQLGGINPSNLVAAGARFSFDLSVPSALGVEYARDPATTAVTVNGTAVAANSLQLNATQILVPSALVAGSNDIELRTTLSNGQPITHAERVWAGDATMRLSLVDTRGLPVMDNIAVRVYPAADPEFDSEYVITNGTFDLPNIPPATMMIEAQNATLQGSIAVAGTATAVTVVMRGIGAPSMVQNDDFSQGLAGYNLGTAPVGLIEHVEGPYPPVDTSGLPRGPNAPPTSGVTAAKTATASGSRSSSASAAAAKGSVMAKPTGGAKTLAGAAPTAGNADLVLETFGQGPQFISRVFLVGAGRTDVRLRYRFVTLEVPFGYFGTEFDDAFGVSIRTSRASRSEFNSMNGLGLAAFDYASGSTAWRDITLPVNPDGDVVQLELTVSNVGDALFDSDLVVDFVEQAAESISPALRWDPRNGGAELTATITGSVQQDRRVDIYFARGTTFESRIGAPVTSVTLPAGSSGTVRRNIAGNLLANDPDGTTHLIAVVSPTRVAHLEDVMTPFGANADHHPAEGPLVNIIRDGLRAAGQAQATITSAFRQPADQARIMFNVLTKKEDLQASISEQYALYGTNGDKVIMVFANLAAGKTRAQVLAMATTVKQAMLDKINELGCVNVTKHCVDPSVRVTLDVEYAPFSARTGNGNGRRYIDAVRPRVDRFIDESCISNNAFHHELSTGGGALPPAGPETCNDGVRIG